MHVHDGEQNYHRTFFLGVTLNIAFVVVELLYGTWAGSLALVADAWHNLSDVLGLLLAWGAYYAANKRPSARYTYGLRKSTILAALGSAILLLVALGAIGWEAIGRFFIQPKVSGQTVLVVAGIGFVINSITALLFFADRKRDLNLRGAFLHMAADALVSLGVLVSGLVIMWTDWRILDPLISLAIVVVILIGTWDLLRQSLGLSLDAAPEGLDVPAVESWLLEQSGVSEVHDLHVWAMSTTETAMSAHLVMPEGASDEWLHSTADGLLSEFHIAHPTLQVERGTQPGACRLEQGDDGMPQAHGHSHGHGHGHQHGHGHRH
ncbi:MAG: cation transporter [Planctomycetota bacterium]|nr:MAG: cation transporter [Planctomycetota bacterium]